MTESTQSNSGLFPADACLRIHQLLATLPAFTALAQVPFADGLYFFYEDSERSGHGVDGRVVRVGNHPRSDGGLRRRLQGHYSGSKNGSVFRKFLGGALLRRISPESTCLSPGPGKGHWERQDEKACASCRPLEAQVSRLLSTGFSFRCIWMPVQGVRNAMEELLVATLASCPECGPSGAWLGLSAYSENVRRTGLWNSQFVDSRTMPVSDLLSFEKLVETTRTWNPQSP